ncbi:MAG: ribonuclease J [Patescibacteria group bacterium]
MLKQTRTGKSSYRDNSRSSGIRRKSSSRTTMPQIQIVRPGMSAAEAAIKDHDSVRFVPLGGLEEVGRNCSFFEYKDEIIIVDVGIQFPEETTPGVDYIIPNIEYLEKNKDKIKAILLTHGHYDHIAAIHYVVGKIANPLIYTADFTKAVVEKRHLEFINAPKLRFDVVKHGDKRVLSEHFEAEFFNVDHTIPDALGFLLKTPAGNMAHLGDFRLRIDKNGKPLDTEVYENLGKRNIHSIFLDCTNSLRPGFSFSEMMVEDNLDKLIASAKHRIILATFASLMTRVFEIVRIAEKYGRKVALNGRSMKDNMAIAQELGYFKPKAGSIIPLEEVNKHKDDKVLILTTGAQGEANAGLMRIVNGEHRIVRLKPTDTVVFSSSVIPGNERSIQFLQDNVARQVDEVYNTKLLDIHASGHAQHEDLKLVMELVKPKFVFPVHGYYFMRKNLVKIAQEVGIPRERVVILDNGDMALFSEDKVTVAQEKVNSSYVMVDGLGVGDVGEVVLRDRLALAQEGMFVVITTMDRKTGRVLKNPDIISRGFIYLKENQSLLDEIRRKVRGIIGRLPHDQQAVDGDYIKALIRDQVGQFLFTKTKRRPMILPVIIEV